VRCRAFRVRCRRAPFRIVRRGECVRRLLRRLAGRFRSRWSRRRRDHDGLAEEEACGGAVVEVALVAPHQRLVALARSHVRTPEHACADYPERRKNERYQRYGVGRANVRERDAGHRVAHGSQGRRRQRCRAEIARQLARTHPPPRKPVASRRQKRGKMHQHHHFARLRHRPPAPRRLAEIEAQRERREISRRHESRVHARPEQPRRDEFNPGLAVPPHAKPSQTQPVSTPAPGCPRRSSRTATARRVSSRACRGNRPSLQA